MLEPSEFFTAQDSEHAKMSWVCRSCDRVHQHLEPGEDHEHCKYCGGGDFEIMETLFP